MLCFSSPSLAVFTDPSQYLVWGPVGTSAPPPQTPLYSVSTFYPPLPLPLTLHSLLLPRQLQSVADVSPLLPFIGFSKIQLHNSTTQDLLPFYIRSLRHIALNFLPSQHIAITTFCHHNILLFCATKTICHQRQCATRHFATPNITLWVRVAQVYFSEMRSRVKMESPLGFLRHKVCKTPPQLDIRTLFSSH